MPGITKDLDSFLPAALTKQPQLNVSDPRILEDGRQRKRIEWSLVLAPIAFRSEKGVAMVWIEVFQTLDFVL